MRINPFSFGAAGYSLYGPEQFLYDLLAANYLQAGRVIEGSPDDLISVALDCKDCIYDERVLRKALNDLAASTKHTVGECNPLIRIEHNIIRPTEHFGILN